MNRLLGAQPFPRLVREGGGFDFLSAETMLANWRFTASRALAQILLSARNSNPPPCRTNRDKDGAPRKLTRLAKGWASPQPQLLRCRQKPKLGQPPIYNSGLGGSPLPG